MGITVTFLTVIQTSPTAAGRSVYLDPVLFILDPSGKIPIIVVIDMGISFYF